MNALLTAVWDGVTQQVGVTLFVLVWSALLIPVRRVRARNESPPLPVYLSCTRTDLEEYRSAAVAAIGRAGGRHVGDEHPAPGADGRTTDERNRQIARSELFLGLYAYAYGADGPGPSPTELDFAAARTANKPRQAWMVGADAAWRRSRMDADPAPIDGLRAAVLADTGTQHHPLPRPAQFAREVERVVVERVQEEYPRKRFWADLASPAGLALAGAVGLAGAASQVVQSRLTDAADQAWLVAGTGLLAALACYFARFAFVRAV